MSIEKSSFDEFADQQEDVAPAITSPEGLAQAQYLKAKEEWRSAVAAQDVQIAAIRHGVALKRIAMENARALADSFKVVRPRGRPRRNSAAVPPIPDEPLDVS